MAKDVSTTWTCKICGGEITVTDNTEQAGAVYDAVRKNRPWQCGNCGNAGHFKLTIVAATHSGNMGSTTTLTNTITHGSSSTAAA